MLGPSLLMKKKIEYPLGVQHVPNLFFHIFLLLSKNGGQTQ